LANFEVCLKENKNTDDCLLRATYLDNLLYLKVKI